MSQAVAFGNEGFKYCLPEGRETVQPPSSPSPPKAVRVAQGEAAFEFDGDIFVFGHEGEWSIDSYSC